MAHRTCDIDGCERAHVARGMCKAHYNKWRKAQPDYVRTSYDRVCDTCGETFQGHRPTARFCNDTCKGVAYRTEKRTRSRELVHVGPPDPVTWLPAKHPAMRSSTTPRPRTWYAGSCDWCSEGYLTLWPQGRYCSDRCSKAQGRVDYRARRGTFAVSRPVRLAIYERDDWTCQLCMEPVDRDLMTLDPQNAWAPSLDHIECQAWTLVPDHSPSNLRLAHRWCNSVRGDESHHDESTLRISHVA